MNILINKATSAVSAVALFAIGSVMAVIGFAVVGMLALFALLTFGLAILAAPLIQLAQSSISEDQHSATAETVA